jgi:hypothetical protein
MRVKTISESEYNRKLVKSRRLSIIGSIACFAGGILFVGSIVDLLNSQYGSIANYALGTIPLGIIAIIGTLLVIKFPVGGRLLCLIMGILMALISSLWGIMLVFGSLLTIVGSIVGLIGGYIKISTPRKISPSTKSPRPSKKKLIENSKKVIDYLKTDDSGITQLRLASVLQIDPVKIKKSLDHLKWLGVIEEKKVSAEEMLFFYKKDPDEDRDKMG